MAFETPPCPVCGLPLQTNTGNPNVYTCSRRKVWVDDLGTYLDIVHASISFSPEGKPVMQLIEIAPYSFLIHNDGYIKRTEIRKVVPQKRKPSDKTKARIFERKLIFKVDAAVDMPWNDYAKVMEKLKTYLLFS